MFARLRKRDESAAAPDAAQAAGREQVQYAVRARPAATADADGLAGVFRRITAEGATPEDRATWMARLRPLIDAERKTLRRRFIADRALDAYRRDYARLADAVVCGLLHIAQQASRPGGAAHRAATMKVSAGSLAAGSLAPGERLDLTFVLPDEAEARARAEVTATFVVDALRELGFEAARTFSPLGASGSEARLEGARARQPAA